MVLGQRQILNSIYRYSNLQTNTHLGQQRRHQTVSRLFTESSLRRRKCAATRCDSRRVNECFIKGSWGWKTCCTMLNKAMPFKPNTFFPPWTLKCNFSYHISQATTSFGAFTHQDFFFFFFSGAARELLRTWSSLPWSFRLFNLPGGSTPFRRGHSGCYVASHAAFRVTFDVCRLFWGDLEKFLLPLLYLLSQHDCSSTLR